VSSGARGLAGDIRALADALEGAEDLADNVLQARLSCSSDAELERIADSLGVEVQTEAGIRVAQKLFGPVSVVVSADSAGGSSVQEVPWAPEPLSGQQLRNAWRRAQSASWAAQRSARGRS
jgi:hypothetical protein